MNFEKKSAQVITTYEAVYEHDKKYTVKIKHNETTGYIDIDVRYVDGERLRLSELQRHEREVIYSVIDAVEEKFNQWLKSKQNNNDKGEGEE